jgi:hypothetical protein
VRGEGRGPQHYGVVAVVIVIVSGLMLLSSNIA